jgi:peptidoglycan/LPS O-acetylase OafA/YrhL
MGKAFFTGRYHFSRDGILTFYRNRALRIVPLAYFAVVVALVIDPSAVTRENIKHIAAILMFDYDGTSFPFSLGLLWSIATEMQFYLMAPFMAFAIFKISKRSGIAPLAFSFLLAGSAYRLGSLSVMHNNAAWTTAVYTPLLGNLDLFGLGMIGAIAACGIKFRSHVGIGLFLLLPLYIASALLWCHVIPSPAGRTAVLIQYCTPPIFGLWTLTSIALLDGASGLPGLVTRRFVAGTQIFGVLTYAVYLWHAPIFEYSSRLLQRPIEASATIAAIVGASVVVFAVAWLSYRIIEKPFHELRIRLSA